MQKKFKKLVKIALVMIYLVILAGAIVRMSGSGMGCPDWPKCFGYLIPPTELSQVVFQPNYEYKKGTIIINNETLLEANKDFKSSNLIDPRHWQAYTKHNYAIFNATHTWIEYINRLLGALSGIPILLFTILSFWLWKKNKWLTIVSIATMLGMGFQAWLGKTVVDSNLLPLKITAHMIMAIIIVAFLLYLLYASSTSKKGVVTKSFKLILLGVFVLTLIQMFIGTQVRQFVDGQIIALGYKQELWMQNPELSYYVHRTLALLVILSNLYLVWQNKKHQFGLHLIKFLIIIIILEIILGFVMVHFHFPILSQPLHLLLAILLFSVQFYLILQVFKFNQTHDLQIQNYTR